MSGGESEAADTLLERGEELGVLAGHLEAASAGEGALILVEGPAGVGKTTLLGAASAQAESQEIRRLAARAGELERDLGFGLVRQLFSPELAGRDADSSERLFAGAASLAKSIFGLTEDGGPGGSPDALARSLHGLQWLTANLADEGPLLLVADDAHWSDEPSLLFLSYLAKALADLPVVVLVAARTGEPGSHADGALVGVRESATLRLNLSPLSRDGCATLVRRAFPDAAEPFVDACHEATGGNPFFVEEIVRAAPDHGISPTEDDADRLAYLSTEAMKQAVVGRIRRAGQQARDLADAVAIFPLGAEARHVGVLADLGLEATALSADTLRRAGVLRAGRPLEFLHPVIRSTVYDSIAESTRAAAHRRAAELLIEEGAAPEQAVFHLLRAEPAGDERSVAILRSAAEAALRSGAYGGARIYAERALVEPAAPERRSELMRDLGAAEGNLGLAEAFDHLREAANTAPTPRLRAEILRELAHALFTTGRFVEIGQVLREAIKGLGPDDRDLAFEIDADLVAIAQMQMLPLDTVDERLDRYRVETLAGNTRGERALLAVFAFDAVRKAEPAALGAELAARALPSAVAAGEVVDSMPLFLGALALIYCEAFDAGTPVYERELRHARETGARRGIGLFATFLGWSSWLRGNLDEAYADATLALETPGIQASGTLPIIAATLAGIHLDRGEVAEAREAFTHVGITDQAAEEVMFDWPLCMRALVATAEGDFAAALHDATVCGERTGVGGAVNPAQMPWRSTAAEAASRLGQTERALELADEELELARRFGAPRTLSMALRTRARLTSGVEAIELLEEALTALEGSAAALERGYALADWGAALRRANRRKEAREPLAEALELASRAGARPLAEHAKQELLATGARPRSELRSGVEALTPSERRVAKLAAEGLSNREIAEGLFVTKKTVEGHLRNAYAKLEIDSRDGLSAVLASSA